MKKLLLLALASVFLTACADEERKYPLTIHVPQHVMGIPCDSVRVDTYCVDYWVDGKQGRVCGEYGISPQ